MLVKPQRRDYIRIIKIRILRLIYRYSTNSPYLSGDSIAKLCDYYAFGRFENRSINLKKLSRAKSIFVPGHRLHDLLDNYGNYITAKTIVSGNSDQNFTSPPSLPDCVSLFLCQNLEYTESKVAHTLPIGLENLRLGRSGRTKFHRFQENFSITEKVLVPPMSPTNPIRARVMSEARLNLELFDIPDSYLNERAYFSLTKKYKFILALEGNGYENHRIWEALYQGSIPVMINSRWSRSLKEYRLPILFVNSIEELSVKKLNEFNSQFGNFNPKSLEALWLPFWSAAIQSGKLDKPKSLTENIELF